MDYFDLSMKKGGLKKAFAKKDLKYCFFVFHQTGYSQHLRLKRFLTALKSINANSSFIEVNTDKGS